MPNEVNKCYLKNKTKEKESLTFLNAYLHEYILFIKNYAHWYENFFHIKWVSENENKLIGTEQTLL